VIIDERTYTIAPGRLGAYLEAHLRDALPIMRRHLGEPYGYFTTETGTLNQFVHLWRYEDMTDRERRRAALYADPDWLAYRERTGATGWVVRQENRLLRALRVPPG
jgi:hypothetical protein